MPGIRRETGFTMIELIITIVILAIVASYAVPSFQQTVLNNRLTAQINEVSSLIAYARSEASKLDSGVITVCSSTDSASCSGNAAWETGWIVFRDMDGDRTVDAGDDQILKVGGALSGGNTFRIVDLTSDSGGYVQFASNGFPIPSATGNAAGTFVVCDDRGASEARAVVVNISGQTRLARDTGGTAGVLNDNNGADLTCP
ncbi:type-4 fimbrial pilin related signal peptide protein [Marinobacter santoriniensis NKSG1]|uniref:Type II secretion system protein H n=1 Tax=Marinobacter santoriniensis NKSG1 TaxID=1288826 RepID=M7CL43_9GAMM|nr:GspH/FimT family pseudopilin [Marinobacter santoriniensis]EMP53924.1 type-4 fimbrial pilin related signal peptide protein [Marinobacter santoriniensis NKSG1]